jgi:hypothetical protein
MALIGQEGLEVVSPSANRKQQHQPYFLLFHDQQDIREYERDP